MQADFERMLRDPAMAFDLPQDVVDDQSLTYEEKLQILDQWELDARELSVAEEENMGGGEPSLLELVTAARASLEKLPKA